MSKRVFVRQMRRQEGFCGVEVLTYCVMDNHFHILLRVTHMRAAEVSDRELVRRYRVLYPQVSNKGRFWQVMEPEALENLLAEGGEDARHVREELLARMHDVSVFMKELKQRFSIWYNQRHDRHGTLWSERFKSILVEGSRSALKVVSAYIDLNPVRAGLARDPKDYIWSGYGAACGGDRMALFGLARMMGGNPAWAESLRRSLEDYRIILYGKGAVPGPGKRVCLDPVSARKVLATGGKLSMSELLLCRVRAICHGVAFGGQDYVMKVGEQRRRRLGLMRKRHPLIIPDFGDELLCTSDAKLLRNV